MATVRVMTVGDSSGIVLPKAALQHLQVGKGDTLYVVEVPGGIQLTPYDPELFKQMQAAERALGGERNPPKKLH
jgi:putative addiction module antidote